MDGSSDSTYRAPTGMAPSAPKPRLLLISLGYLDDIHEHSAHLIHWLSLCAILIQIEEAQTAITILTTAPEQVDGVILGDAEIAKDQHAALRSLVVKYAWSGGTVVLGYMFSTLMTTFDASRFFEQMWGLPWKVGTSERALFFAKPSQGNKLYKKEIPNEYSFRAVSLHRVKDVDRVYMPTEESYTVWDVFLADPVSDYDQTAVAFAGYGHGWLGYVGDVESEENTTRVVLAMFDIV